MFRWLPVGRERQRDRERGAGHAEVSMLSAQAVIKPTITTVCMMMPVRRGLR
jgi:hypothetical protein